MRITIDSGKILNADHCREGLYGDGRGKLLVRAETGDWFDLQGKAVFPTIVYPATVLTAADLAREVRVRIEAGGMGVFDERVSVKEGKQWRAMP